MKFPAVTEQRGGACLQRRISLDVLGTFNDSEVGEAKLVCCLYQAHSIASHLQQHFPNPHRRRVFPKGHLRGKAETYNQSVVSQVKRSTELVGDLGLVKSDGLNNISVAKLCTNQQEAGVHKTESPRAADASAAVHHHRPLVRIQAT